MFKHGVTEKKPVEIIRAKRRRKESEGRLKYHVEVKKFISIARLSPSKNISRPKGREDHFLLLLLLFPDMKNRLNLSRLLLRGARATRSLRGDLLRPGDVRAREPKDTGQSAAPGTLQVEGPAGRSVSRELGFGAHRSV